MKNQTNFSVRNFAFSTFLFVAIIISTAAGTLSAQSVFSDRVEKLWETDAVFKVPESVFYDVENKVLYMSNINGNPTEKDGNGYLSMLDLDGNVLKQEWITGLNAPKGMGQFNGKLYVADIDKVAEIDIKKHTILNFYEAAGAQFLNDITIDNNGNVYISDMATGAVYQIANGKITEWIPAGTFDSPNGMNFDKGLIYTGMNGKIVSIDPETKVIKTVAEFDGGVDGLEIDKAGNFIFSDWSGKVQTLKKGEKPILLFNTTDDKINAADVHLMRDKNILLVPTFFDNRIMAYRILN